MALVPESPPRPQHELFRERFVHSFLDWVMLAILVQRPTYGYELIQIIGDEYNVYVSPGSLYPILYDLERSGLIAGTWDHPDRKTRKVYTLTPGGDRALADGLETFARVIHSLRRDGETSPRRSDTTERSAGED